MSLPRLPPLTFFVEALSSLPLSKQERRALSPRAEKVSHELPRNTTHPLLFSFSPESSGLVRRERNGRNALVLNI